MLSTPAGGRRGADGGCPRHSASAPAVIQCSSPRAALRRVPEAAKGGIHAEAALSRLRSAGVAGIVMLAGVPEGFVAATAIVSPKLLI